MSIPHDPLCAPPLSPNSVGNLPTLFSWEKVHMCEHIRRDTILHVHPHHLAHTSPHNIERLVQLTSGGCLCFSMIVSTSCEPRTAVAPAGPAIAPGDSSC